MDRLSSDILQIFFSYLTSGEISKLCRSNKQFNHVALRELMWKDRVCMNYGIDKMYGSSWKETAKNLYLCNMINLNEKWMNEMKNVSCSILEGATYREILDLAVNKGIDGSIFVEKMRDEAISKVAHFSSYYEGKKKSFIYDEEMLQSYAYETPHLDSEFNQETLDYLKKTLTREIIVVIVSLSVIEEKHLLPSETYFDFDFENAVVPQLPKDVRFTALFDYVPYVIQFSSFTNEQLWILFDNI